MEAPPLAAPLSESPRPQYGRVSLRLQAWWTGGQDVSDLPVEDTLGVAKDGMCSFPGCPLRDRHPGAHLFSGVLEPRQRGKRKVDEIGLDENSVRVPRRPAGSRAGDDSAPTWGLASTCPDDPEQLTKLCEYVTARGGSAELLAGWTAKRRARDGSRGGLQPGQPGFTKMSGDTFYYSPTRAGFRSRTAVAKHLGLLDEEEAGEMAPPKPKRKNLIGPSSASAASASSSWQPGGGPSVRPPGPVVVAAVACQSDDEDDEFELVVGVQLVS